MAKTLNIYNVGPKDELHGGMSDKYCTSVAQSPREAIDGVIRLFKLENEALTTKFMGVAAKGVDEGPILVTKTINNIILPNCIGGATL